jgi:hypothetical protein
VKAKVANNVQKDARAAGATRLDGDDTVDAFITDDIAMGDEGERDWNRFPVPGPGLSGGARSCAREVERTGRGHLVSSTLLLAPRSVARSFFFSPSTPPTTELSQTYSELTTLSPLPVAAEPFTIPRHLKIR